MKSVLYDPVKCAACKTCEIQCAVAHSRSRELFPAMSETPVPLPRVTVAWSPGLNVPVKCAHCEAAACLAGCPAGAIRRDPGTGAVLLDEARCIGCFSCILVCPVGAVRPSADRKRASKCDGCAGRVAEGLEPACVASCPTGALCFRDVGELSAERVAAAVLRNVAAVPGRAGAGTGKGSPLESILKMREEMSRG